MVLGRIVGVASVMMILNRDGALGIGECDWRASMTAVPIHEGSDPAD
jgi:hypothetical protein